MGEGLAVDRWTARLEHVTQFGFQVGVYDVYTEVSHYMEWFEKTVLDNGGMAACGFTFSAPPSTNGRESLACNIGGCGRFRSSESSKVFRSRYKRSLGTIAL